MKSNYEAIVIGSGPAGSTAAYELAENNVETLLIEKEDLPRHKTCGGGLTDKTIRLMNRVFDENPRDLSQDNIVNFDTVDCRFGFQERTLSEFEVDDEVYFTDRQKYDYHLFKQAKSAGTKTIINEPVTEINLEESRLETGSGDVYQYGHLFAADGVHSPTRKALLEEDHIECPYWYDQLAIGLEAYVPRDQAPAHFSDSQWLDLHLGVINWGYGWVFPHEDNLLVGVGGLETENDDVRSALMDYGELLGFDLSDVPIKGHPIPFGNYLKNPFHKNVLLLGDAGGLADPITGEGIFYAQRSGELAAKAFLNARENSSVGKKYGQLVKDHILPEMTGAWRLRPLLYGGSRELRRPLYTISINAIDASSVFNIAHGHRVWHDLSDTGHEFHDTLKIG